MATWHILVNPISGVGAAPEFVDKHVIPLLAARGERYRVHETRGVGDAGRIGRAIADEAEAASQEHGQCRGEGGGQGQGQGGVEGLAPLTPPLIRVIVAGGDGTAHEMMEGVVEDGVRGKWGLVVLPLGTANALHSTLFPPDTHSEATDTERALASLRLALDGATPRPLPVTLTRIHGDENEQEQDLDTIANANTDPNANTNDTPAGPIPSHIVLSTALHANILADSEALRAAHPGLERFKMAAAANISEFFRADVTLLPGVGGGVRQYDPERGWVVPYTVDSASENVKGDSDGDDGSVTLSGPFAYLLSSTTTTRLEPTFVIAPTLATPGEGTMDIIVLRPLRDPLVRAARARGESGADEWAARAAHVLGAAYQDGKHVGLRYGDPGHAGEARGEAEGEGSTHGEVVVEVFRCGGFEWRPTDAAHPKSHIVCADGSLYTIPRGGRAVARVVAEDGGGFWVWG